MKNLLKLFIFCLAYYWGSLFVLYFVMYLSFIIENGDMPPSHIPDVSITPVMFAVFLVSTAVMGNAADERKRIIPSRLPAALGVGAVSVFVSTYLLARLSGWKSKISIIVDENVSVAIAATLSLWFFVAVLAPWSLRARRRRG